MIKVPHINNTPRRVDLGYLTYGLVIKLEVVLDYQKSKRMTRRNLKSALAKNKYLDELIFTFWYIM